MAKVEPRTLSGFMELLPNDQLKFNKLYDTIKSTYEQFGFLPLDTPIIEASEVLLAKAGGETEKQIYQIKRGDSDLTLRFDLTVPLAKYVAKNYGYLSFPFRRYQIGKVYRGERAQKGRFREFYQCDIDIIGDGELNILNDAEVPYIIYTLFNKMKIGDFVIKINNRKILNAYFESYDLSDRAQEIMRIIDKLPKVGMDAVKEELSIILDDDVITDFLSFFDIKGSNFEILNLLESIGQADNPLFALGVKELREVVEHAEEFGLNDDNLQIDLTIARGLDYYTGTVYETFLKDYPELGSICSGGRYDNLAEYYTDRKLPGVGISIGLTRLFDKLQELDLLKDEKISVSDVLIIPMTDNYKYIIKCYNFLLNMGKSAQIFYDKRSMKSMINYALDLNIPYIVFIGDDEVNNQTMTIKRLDNHDQRTFKLEDIEKEMYYE